MRRSSRVLPKVSDSLKQNGSDVALFKAILDLKLNSNRPRDTEVISVKEFDELLKKQLVAAYPKYCEFRKTDGAFKFKFKFKDKTFHQQIAGALGCSSMENIVFDYSRFNPVSLMRLDNDFPHPLWKVLKSTLAISEQFSPHQKIQAYIDVANAYFNKELGHGDRYLGALEMAREAYAVARAYPTPENILLVKNAFMPVYSAKYPEDLAEQQQFGSWIVSECERHKEADVQEIKSELMGKLNDGELLPALSLQRAMELQEGPIGTFNQQRKVRDAAREALKVRLIESFLTKEMAMESAVPAVTEFIDYGENFIASMLTFYRILQMMSQQGWLTSLEKGRIKDYLDTIEAVVSAYNGLDIPTLFKNRSDVTALTIELLKKVNSPAFVSYQAKVTDLMKLNPSIDALQLKYPERMWVLFDVYMQAFERGNYVSGNFHSVRDYTSKSMQCTTKYPILMSPIEKRFKRENVSEELTKLISDATQTVSTNATNVNEAIRAQENADNIATFARQLAGVEMAQFKKEPKIGLLQAILKLNLNNPKEDASSDAVKGFDAYVKALLVVAYESSVTIDDNSFQIKVSGELCNDDGTRLGLMLEALGINADDNKNGRVVFDPSRFNEDKLDLLIEKEAKNGLWLVLKSTMPVTTTFTALDKIETYIDLAGQFFEGNIGKTDKYLGAYAMAEASIAMAKAFPSEETYNAVKKAFEPTAEELADTALKSLVENKQYGNMILAKHSDHDKLNLKKKDRQEMRELLSSLTLRVSEPTLLSSSVLSNSDKEVTSSMDTSSELGDGLPLESQSLSPIETNDSDNGSSSDVTNLVEDESSEQEVAGDAAALGSPASVEELVRGPDTAPNQTKSVDAASEPLVVIKKESIIDPAAVKFNPGFSKKFLAIAAGVGAAVCVGAGLALTLTGVFAPLGVGALGLGVAAGVSAVTGVGLGSAFYLIGRKIKSWFGSGSGAGVAKITGDAVADRGAKGSYAKMLGRSDFSSSARPSDNAVKAEPDSGAKGTTIFAQAPAAVEPADVESVKKPAQQKSPQK